MAIFGNPKSGGFMDEIRCDEPSYLIWKWHPSGSASGNNNRENAIRWGSSLRVKDGEVAVFVYKQPNGITQDFIEGPFDQKIETKNFPVLQALWIGLCGWYTISGRSLFYQSCTDHSSSFWRSVL